MARRKIKGLRWYVAGLLCLVTTINYIDRTSLGVAGPVLRRDLGINENQFANIIIWFQFSYLVMQPVAGRIIDWLGTKAGFSLAVIWWSVANILHAFARTPLAFGAFRGLLGMGEAGNFPGVAKVASEWFPPRERTVATGIANVGSGTGALIATPLVAYILVEEPFSRLLNRMGWNVSFPGWQEAFVFTGAIGFVWVAMWWWFYRPPGQHPNMTEEELEYIQAGQQEFAVEPEQPVDLFCPACGCNLRGLPDPRCPECGSRLDLDRLRAAARAPAAAGGVWGPVLQDRNFWGIALTRFLAEPAWQFFSYWIVMYMMDQKGINLKQVAYFAWVPFLAADVGSFLGGLLSPFYQRIGLPVLTARKTAMLSGALMMPFLLMVLSAPTPGWAIFWFCFGPFGHNIISSVVLTLPADLFPKRAVATANGLSGCMGYIGGMLFTKIVGMVVTATHNYVPIFCAMAVLDLVGAVILFSLVRMPRSQHSTSLETRTSM